MSIAFQTVLLKSIGMINFHGDPEAAADSVLEAWTDGYASFKIEKKDSPDELELFFKLLAPLIIIGHKQHGRKFVSKLFRSDAVGALRINDGLPFSVLGLLLDVLDLKIDDESD